ncbi:MAG: catalase, partial [Firmicutes bacterium]|nr:catalase [Bacillota bacterium]
MMDLSLLAALSDFARKRPPRNICAKGIAARGWFQPYMELSEFTAAKIFTDPDAKIPTIVRFSLFSGLPGAADTRRDLRCMDVKFLTDEGEFDLLSGSFPRFFVQDPGKIPELMKALQPEPGSGTGDRDSLWKFAAAHPEAMPAMLWLYSDRGTAKSYDQPEYWGPYPLALKNKDGETFLMDWKWEPEQGFSTITSGEAEFYAGFDPDAAGRDLREKLQGEKPLTWELLLKIRTPDGLEEQWIHAGKLILTEVLDRETEDTLLFLPHTLPKGIFPTDDPLAEGLTWLLQEEHRQRVHHSCEASTSLRSTSLAIRANITGGTSPPTQDSLLHNLTQDLLFLDEATQEAI